MDVARVKETGELIEAEELWCMNFVDRDGYICHGCAIQVFPASYDREKNKKRPYFALGPVNKHLDGCDVCGQEKFIKQAEKQSVGSPEGFPLPFPNRLTLDDERPVTAEPKDFLPTGGATRANTNSNGQGTAPKKHHGHTVKSIRPACQTFIKFPFDRKALPLSIPDIAGNTYAKIFKYLKSGKPEFFPAPKHLYYAPIRWTVEPVASETFFEITLNVGEWDDTSKGYKSLSKVRVDWSEWSQSRRKSLMREINVTKDEASEKARVDSQFKGLLFFIGTQDSSDPATFHVDSYRFICGLAAKLIWPK